MRFRNVSGHPDVDEDGSAIGAGAYFELSDEQQEIPSNQAKIEAMQWIHAPEVPDTPSDTEESKKGKKSGFAKATPNNNDDKEGDG